MDEFDRLAMHTPAELLQSEAMSPGSQDADLIEAARFVLINLGGSPDSLHPPQKSAGVAAGEYGSLNAAR